MKISIIAAVSENGVIGKDGEIPWYLPSDLKHFKELTTGHHIIMGRKTYESIGKPLPDRTNVIVTRQQDYKTEGVEVVHSLDAALELVERSGNTQCFIIGGGEIFRQAMDKVNKIYLTRVHTKTEGDTYFPELDPLIWKEVSREQNLADEKNPYPYDFVVYERTY